MKNVFLFYDKKLHMLLLEGAVEKIMGFFKILATSSF